MTRQTKFLIALSVLAITFIVIPRVYADNCSSDSDCANVVNSNGCMSAFLGLLIGTAAAATPRGWKSKSDEHPFKNCQEARDWLVHSPDPAHTDFHLNHAPPKM